MGTFRVSGEKLVALLKTHAADNESALHVVGLRKDGDKWLVNERAVVEGQSYSVATTSFVATGGDSLIDTTGISFSRSDKTLFSLLASYFSKRRLKGNIALHQEFSAPANRILLAGSARLTTSLALSAIGNGASSTRYSRPLLRRDSVTTLAVELALFGSASTVDHSVEVDVQIQYGRTWTTAQGSQETIVAEAQDRFASNLLYRFSRLRNRFGKRWFVPEPYAELNLISELTPSGTYVDSAGVTQTYHLLDLAAAVGLGLQLHPMLFAKVGFVVRGEALTPTAADPDLPARPGLYLGYTLRRLKLLQDSATPIELESRLDLVMTALASDVRRDLTWQNQLSIALFDYVKLSVSQRLYVFDTTLRDASVANDVMVGLSFGVDRRLQTY